MFHVGSVHAVPMPTVNFLILIVFILNVPVRLALLVMGQHVSVMSVIFHVDLATAELEGPVLT